MIDGACIPDDWRYGVLVSLCEAKKGVRDLEAYRGVQWLEHEMKVAYWKVRLKGNFKEWSILMKCSVDSNRSGTCVVHGENIA